MTLEQLQAMSNRELDALAAKKVMGWTEPDFQPDGYVLRDDTWDIIITFAPTEDMTDAWEMLKRPEIMDRVQIGIYPTSFGQWIARSYMPGYNINVQDHSPCRAITIAAILAKEE